MDVYSLVMTILHRQFWTFSTYFEDGEGLSMQSCTNTRRVGDWPTKL